LVFSPSTEILAQAIKPEDAFETLLLSGENIRLLTSADWNHEKERSIEEMLAELIARMRSNSNTISVPSRFGPSKLTAVQKSVLRGAKKIISDMCSGSGAALLENPEFEGRGLLIGAWINLFSSHHGMVYACEFGQLHNRDLKASIEHLWNGIGQWLR
jgi:hypothetical protein